MKKDITLHVRLPEEVKRKCVDKAKKKYPGEKNALSLWIRHLLNVNLE